MNSFLYPSSPPSALGKTSLLNPNPNSSSDPNSNPSLCLHDSGVEFPAVERDYMGIGLGFKHVSAKGKGPSSNLAGSSTSEDLEFLADNLYLKLAPPSSNADNGEADDGEPLSGNVGWPPISSYRKATTRSLSNIRPPCNDRGTSQAPPLLTPQASLIGDTNHDGKKYGVMHHALENDASSSKPLPTKLRKPLHIKVSMDGTPIMRKLELISMQGYQHLFLELRKLFKFYKRNLSCEMGVRSSFKDSKGANFILTYKDKDGEWMLVGDTPWETFAHTAKRIRIMKMLE